MYVFVCLFVFVALRPMSTAMVIAGRSVHLTTLFPGQAHMGQYPLLSVLSDRISPLNIDHSRNLPVEICGINYTEKYTNL